VMEVVDQYLSGLVRGRHTPSLQYRIFDKERIIHSFNDGFRDIGKKLPADPATTYHAYSVTKTFTSLAVMQLCTKYGMDIDNPVSDVLTGFRYGADITIRELLAHSAGIPNPLPLKWVHPPGDFDAPDFFESVMDKFPERRSPPNQKFSYSNLGYVILGQWIEIVSGMKYEEYITSHIIAPLGQSASDLGFGIPGDGRNAKGYQKRFSFLNLVLGFMIDKDRMMGQPEGGWNVFNDFCVNGAAYGGLIGTADAFRVFLTDFLRTDSILVGSREKKLLFTENCTNNGKPTGMCLSWFKGELKGNVFYTHAGGGGGYYCEIRLYPDAGIGSVLMLNRTGIRDERMLDRIDSRFIG
jgi:D-alanyl-D-alanine carboxypeptidase